MGLFILLSLIVTVLVARSILQAGRRPEPTGFNLDPDKNKKPTAGGPRPEVVREPGRGASNGGANKAGFKTVDRSAAEKSLNCWFQFNGHSWDAYEALGVPAGADEATCRKAYEVALKNAPDQEFIKFAWTALQETLKKGGTK